MNKELLRSKMALRSYRQKDLAALLGINSGAISRKMNGITPFSLEEVTKIKKWLSLSNKDTSDIFLN